MASARKDDEYKPGEDFVKASLQATIMGQPVDFIKGPAFSVEALKGFAREAHCEPQVNAIYVILEFNEKWKNRELKDPEDRAAFLDDFNKTIIIPLIVGDEAAEKKTSKAGFDFGDFGEESKKQLDKRVNIESRHTNALRRAFEKAATEGADPRSGLQLPLNVVLFETVKLVKTNFAGTIQQARIEKHYLEQAKAASLKGAKDPRQSELAREVLRLAEVEQKVREETRRLAEAKEAKDLADAVQAAKHRLEDRSEGLAKLMKTFPAPAIAITQDQKLKKGLNGILKKELAQCQQWLAEIERIAQSTNTVNARITQLNISQSQHQKYLKDQQARVKEALNSVVPKGPPKSPASPPKTPGSGSAPARSKRGAIITHPPTGPGAGSFKGVVPGGDSKEESAWAKKMREEEPPEWRDEIDAHRRRRFGK